WIQSVEGAHTNMVFGSELTTRVFIRDMANFTSTGAYVEVPLASRTGTLSASMPGNYAVLDSLTADAFLLRTAKYNYRAPINALQIIPRISGQAPRFASQPARSLAYGGQTARFAAPAVGALPIAYQWKKNGVDLVDGANISGASTSVLVIRNVSASDQGDYTVTAANAFGPTTSDAASLAILSPAANSYAEKVLEYQPAAFWRLNETDLGDMVARDYVGGFNGTYLPASWNGASGVAGPQKPDFAGFESTNSAVQTTYNTAQSWVSTPALNIETNQMSVAMWIYPTASQASWTGLYFSRSGTNMWGLGYGNGNQLAYNWGDRPLAYNFISGLVVPTNTWSLVALTITPSNATLYRCNASGMTSATNHLGNASIRTLGDGLIGVDNGTLNRVFQGSIDEVAVFDRALLGSEIFGLYKRSLGLNAMPPIVTAPSNRALFAGRTARFTVNITGDEPLACQWKKNGADVSDDSRITGSKTPNLVIGNVGEADAGSYAVWVTNPAGSTASDAAALTVVPLSAAGAYETALRNASPLAYWRLNEASGATAAHDYWGGYAGAHADVAAGIDGPRSPDFVGLEIDNLAASYNGASSATSTDASLMNNRSQFSILGWFNVSGPVGERAGLFGQNDVVEFGFHGADGSGLAVLGFWTPYGYASMSQTNIQPGQWYMVAAVGDGSAVRLHLLSKTGALQASASNTTTNYGQSVYPFRIGGGGILDSTGNWFPGQIDEVAVFDRALNAEELATLFGAAFTGGALPPTFAAHPVSRTVYAGMDIQFSASVLGSAPIEYEWRKDSAKVNDGGNISGATTPAIRIVSATAENAGEYVLVAQNPAGTAESTPAVLNVITPVAGSYEDLLVSFRPHAYYRLNEIIGSETAFDYYGGFHGAYGSTAMYSQGAAGVANPPFVGFESTNTAVQFFTGSSGNYVTAPFGATATNAITFTAWVYPAGPQADWSGILMSRTSGSGGMGYNDEQMLAYTWNADSTWSFDSGLAIPTNQWSFVAVVIQPDRGVLYLGNGGTIRSAQNVVAHTPDALGNNWRIGTDDNSGTDTGARGFNGTIDEVAVFTYSLTPEQIQMLYGAATAGPQIRIEVSRAPGGDLILTWPTGTLFEADAIGGNWQPSSMTSGAPFAPTAQGKFYRVQVK
ncbi:MAG: immunoglobulin domain-containing protein, partial [Verrucomicrobia bacterium]|nr:immunoglobulin domain-containing protein [Verrucomicrobiota bacterium]